MTCHCLTYINCSTTKNFIVSQRCDNGGYQSLNTDMSLFFSCYSVLNCRSGSKNGHIAGMKVMAGQRAMSGQNGDFTRQKLHSPVMLTGHVMFRWSGCSVLSKQLNPEL